MVGLRSNKGGILQANLNIEGTTAELKQRSKTGYEEA